MLHIEKSTPHLPMFAELDFDYGDEVIESRVQPPTRAELMQQLDSLLLRKMCQDAALRKRTYLRAQ